MEIRIVGHPTFMQSQSMPRFARMLLAGAKERGHSATLLAADPYLYNLASSSFWKKWLGYFDQYIIFGFALCAAVLKSNERTIFVLCDQALGPLAPIICRRPHVVHVHDLLALSSALGEVPLNRTSLSGRIYQRLIRAGFRTAKNFISISEQTKYELHRIGGVKPTLSVVIYNGLNYSYGRLPAERARAVLAAANLCQPSNGFLLHVSGGQWYKNTAGLYEIYIRYASKSAAPAELWVVGPGPSESVLNRINAANPKAKIRSITNIENLTLQALYSLAEVLLAPSHAEGFGWPILEALACRCKVITTRAKPMTEVGGSFATYIDPLEHPNIGEWADRATDQLIALMARENEMISLLDTDVEKWVGQFDRDKTIAAYLCIYEKVLTDFECAI